MRYVFWWVPNLATVLDAVKEPLQTSKEWQIGGLIVLVVIAMLLHRLKKKLTVAFGILELVGGGWTIWSTFNQNFENTIVYALALGGGVFLLVNGLENLLKDERKRLDTKEKLE